MTSSGTPPDATSSRDLPGQGRGLRQPPKDMELMGGTFKLDIQAILANEEHAVTLLRASGEREGKALNDNTVQVFHIRDGEVTESWLHPSDAYASDEFWS